MKLPRLPFWLKLVVATLKLVFGAGWESAFDKFPVAISFLSQLHEQVVLFLGPISFAASFAFKAIYDFRHLSLGLILTVAVSMVFSYLNKLWNFLLRLHFSFCTKV